MLNVSINAITDRSASINRMQFLLETIPSKLLGISKEEFLQKQSTEKWSKKEILGHLIDSAANNHHRFIRIQYEKNPVISYDQEQWNKLNYWQDCDTHELINFWLMYNHHLLKIIRNIPDENLFLTCTTDVDKTVTLEFLIADYIEHQEHHLRQLIKI
jgi:hypothetical protein